MKKKILVLIISVAIIATVIFVYYVMAINKLNMCFKSANNGMPIDFVQSEIISFEDFKTISSVKPVDQSLDYYVNGGTMSIPQKIGLNTISFKCVSNYTVIDANNDKVIQSVDKEEFIVKLKFEKMKWIVISVENNTTADTSA